MHSVVDSIPESKGSPKFLLWIVPPSQPNPWPKMLHEIISPTRRDQLFYINCGGPIRIADFQISYPMRDKKKNRRDRTPWKRREPPLERKTHSFLSHRSFPWNAWIICSVPLSPRCQ